MIIKNVKITEIINIIIIEYFFSIFDLIHLSLGLKDINNNKYIKNGSIPGPVAGEFLFVYEHLQKKLKLKLLPDAWVTRWDSQWPDEKFRSDIKLVHFTHSLNKPHEWSGYAKYSKL